VESRMDAAHWQVVSSPRDAGSATCTTTASDGRTLSYLRVDAARCDHRERRVAKGTVAYRRALPAWHHEDRQWLMIRATTRQARRISAAPIHIASSTYCKRRNLKFDFSSIAIRRLRTEASPILRASPAAAVPRWLGATEGRHSCCSYSSRSGKEMLRGCGSFPKLRERSGLGAGI